MKRFGSEVYLVPSPDIGHRMTERRREPVRRPLESDVVRYLAELEEGKMAGSGPLVFVGLVAVELCICRGGSRPFASIDR